MWAAKDGRQLPSAHPCWTDRPLPAFVVIEEMLVKNLMNVA
jgi:hypothetical protein